MVNRCRRWLARVMARRLIYRAPRGLLATPGTHPFLGPIRAGCIGPITIASGGFWDVKGR